MDNPLKKDYNGIWGRPKSSILDWDSQLSAFENENVWGYPHKKGNLDISIADVTSVESSNLSDP